MEEIFKDIEGYDGLYQVSNLGRVKSLERKMSFKNGYRIVHEKILKPNNGNGYQKVILCRDGKMKTMTVHRLVAEAFISNPYNLPDVNHIDENKRNNSVENLEWCDERYNCNFGSRNKRIAKARTNNTKLSKPIMCVETKQIYPSTNEVQRKLGFDKSSISKCCNKKYGYKTVKGFHWKYVE